MKSLPKHLSNVVTYKKDRAAMCVHTMIAENKGDAPEPRALLFVSKLHDEPKSEYIQPSSRPVRPNPDLN